MEKSWVDVDKVCETLEIIRFIQNTTKFKTTKTSTTERQNLLITKGGGLHISEFKRKGILELLMSLHSRG